MFEPTIWPIIRRFSVLLVLIYCLIAAKSQMLFADNTEQPPSSQQEVKLEYMHRDDKIIKIVQVKNLDKESWITDLEIELKNVSGKPIYLLQLDLYFPEVPPLPGADRTGLGWSYGNEYLINNDRLADLTDIPIKPGESFVYKPPKEGAESLRKRIANDHIPAVTKAILRFYVINFGDGTGYISGVPAPQRVHPKPVEQTFSLLLRDKPSTLEMSSLVNTGKFSFVKASYKDTNPAFVDNSESLQGQACGPVDKCHHFVLVPGLNCPMATGICTTFVGSSNDPAGLCGTIEFLNRSDGSCAPPIGCQDANFLFATTRRDARPERKIPTMNAI